MPFLQFLGDAVSVERGKWINDNRTDAGGGEPAQQPEKTAPVVGLHLDSDDNQVRVAAINALRGIVDGQGPLEELSVFGAIELAKTWRARVGR